ncbi:hypothetical protein BAE44_0001395 [Dichanthelium oligosanthes]|uniref:Late embryogenesis abundant protein LEA-2 subgroup domain-containing protein n=1 Tax=Dichanthelium oligosanthes TaxID=888268 RepID=A0A1E5WJK7_9POAL|nr:hypothetical protein BAE44_0001395 [Dichanthelium oligosanthes]
MAPPPAAAGHMAQKAKRFVLGALAATLAVAVVVTVSFVILSPARVHVSVTYARVSRGKSQDGGVVELLLTLGANNTSGRAAVRYESMFIDLTNSTNGPELESCFVRANLTTALPLSQRRGSVASFDATVVLVPGLWTDASGNMMGSNRFAVIVTAMARFKVGIARTRLFDIKLACRPASDDVMWGV